MELRPRIAVQYLAVFLYIVVKLLPILSPGFQLWFQPPDHIPLEIENFEVAAYTADLGSQGWSSIHEQRSDHHLTNHAIPRRLAMSAQQRETAPAPRETDVPP